MNLEMLKYFHYVAKYNNITHAAKQLFISQSTLSRYIMALEMELGVKLLERNNKQVELTEAGRELYKDSLALIDLSETVIKNVKAADQGQSGLLRLTLPSQLFYVLQEPFAAMEEKHPAVQFVLESYLFDEIPNAIQHDLYNIGFTYDFATVDPEQLESVPVAAEDFSLVIPSRAYPADCHGEGDEKQAVQDTIDRLPLMLPSFAEPPFIKRALSILQEYSNAKAIDTRYVNTTESVLLNVALGLCYSIVPASMAQLHASHGQVTFLELPELTAKCKIIMLHKRTGTDELTNNFVKVVKDCVATQCRF